MSKKLPEGWCSKQLAEISIRIMVGIASAATHAYSATGVRLLRNLNIKEGWIDESDVIYINQEYENIHRNKRLKQGDIVTVRTGYPGLSAVIPQKLEGAQCFTSLITRLNKRIVLPEYVCTYINSEFGKKLITAGEAGGAQKNVNAGTLEKIVIPIPPLLEQQKIANILSIWDAGIDCVQKLLENSRQQKKALVQQLLTGKKRLPGFSGEWKLEILSTLFKRVNTRNQGQSTNVVTISAQQGLIKQEEFFKKTVASEVLDNYFLLKKGQFAYNKSYSQGFPMGVIKRLNRYEVGVVTTLYICFEIKDVAKCNSDFFEHYFEHGSLNQALEKVANEGGRAHGLLNVKPDDFFSLKLPYPPLPEQAAIAKVLSAAVAVIAQYEAKLANLQSQKKALMQQLLTGKKRVKVDAPAEIS